jgi:acyl-CoA synthetase (AMP-forming)/AMP-acid ligase II/acyl carrier protein
MGPIYLQSLPQCLRLAHGLVTLQLDDDEILIGRPAMGPLHLTRALWSIAEQFATCVASVDVVAHFEKLGVPPGVANGSIFFLGEQRILVPKNSTWAPLPDSPRSRGHEFAMYRPNLDRFRQIVQPYSPEQAAQARIPMRVLLLGPCQAQALAEALGWVGACRGYNVSIVGALDVEEVLSGGRFDVAVLPLAQYATKFLERLAFGEFDNCTQLIPGIIARCDEAIDILNHKVVSQVIVLGLGRPTMTNFAPGSAAHQRMQVLLTRLADELTRALSTIDGSIKILDQEAAMRLWGFGEAFDDEFNVLSHHSPIASWSLVVLKPGVTDEAYDSVNRAHLYPPCSPGRTDPTIALAEAISWHFPARRETPIELVAIDPVETLWPTGGMPETAPRPGAFVDVEDFRFSGTWEALEILKRRGIQIAFVLEGTKAHEVLLSRDEMWVGGPLFRYCDAVIEGADWSEALRTVADDLDIAPERVLAVRCGQRRPTSWQGAWYGGDGWQLRRVLLTSRALHRDDRLTCDDASGELSCSDQQRSQLQSSEVSERVAAAVCAVLNKPRGAGLPRDLRDVGLDSFGALEVIHAVEEALDARFDPSDLTPVVAFDFVRLTEAAQRAMAHPNTARVAPEIHHDPWLGLSEKQWQESTIASLLSRPEFHDDWQVRELLSVGSAEARFWSRNEILRIAAGIGCSLRQAGTRPGERVLIALSGWVQRAAAVLGALAAELVPVVHAEYPDSDDERGRWVKTARRLASAVAARCTLSDAATIAVLQQAGICDVLGCTDIEPADFRDLPPPTTAPGAAALIQYTSGTTGEPKISVVTREHLLTELWHIGHALALCKADRIVSFLPQHHAFGLFMTTLLPMFCAVPITAIRTADWLLSPVSWLVEVTGSRGTLAFMTPSAARHIAVAARRAAVKGLNLTSIRMLVWAGEPANLETQEEVLSVLRHYGLRRSAMAVQYGMTEAVAAITQTQPGRSASRQAIRATELHIGEDVTPRKQRSTQERIIVACGKPLPSHTVRIVGTKGNNLPPLHLGHIILSGQSVTHTDHQADFSMKHSELRTGDVGFIADGELYVIGRSDEVVIVNGINVWPEAAEAAARLGVPIDGATYLAFGIEGPGHASQVLVMVVDLPPEIVIPEDLDRRIAAAVRHATGVTPAKVVIQPAAFIVRTASGKLDRYKTRDRFLATVSR